MTEFAQAEIDALRMLRDAYPEAEIAIIGAAALHFHLPMTWRKTADIDLVIAVSVSDLEEGLARIPGWTRDERREQRWYAPNGVGMDLVPAPPDVVDQGSLVWPTSQQTMNLDGVGLALAAEPREVAPGLDIRLPS